MKKAFDFYRKDTAYRIMKKDWSARYGKDTVEIIWATASANLDRLYKQFDSVPDGQRFHVYDEILPRIAMYRALQRQMPGKALDMMNDAVALTGSKVSSILGKITSLPGMPTVFLSVMRYMVKTMFGIDAGFRHTIHQTDKTVFKVDITQCPYCHYCRLCHCPELAPNFCISDVYCYGNLPGVVFTRTGTIGIGATCCDFTFALEKKK